MKSMPSCNEVTRLVSEGLDRQLGFGARVALRVHFMMCRGCRNFEEHMRRLRQAIQELSRGEDERPA